MSGPLSTLKFARNLLNPKEFYKNSLTKRGLRCRKVSCDPCTGSTKLTKRPKPIPCEKVPGKKLKCTSWDRCRDPNLCNCWISPMCAGRFSLANEQKFVCASDLEKEGFEIRKPAYPHKPWPTFRNAPWSPTIYVKTPCSCGHCKMLDYSKMPLQLGTSRCVQSIRAPLSKSYSTCKPKSDPCKPKEDPCKPKPDPCKAKPDPCKPKEDPCNPCKPKKCECTRPCNCNSLPDEDIIC